MTVGQSFDDVRQWPQRIAQVKKEDIQRVAQIWLKKEYSVTGLLKLRPKQ